MKQSGYPKGAICLQGHEEYLFFQVPLFAKFVVHKSNATGSNSNLAAKQNVHDEVAAQLIG